MVVGKHCGGSHSAFLPTEVDKDQLAGSRAWLPMLATLRDAQQNGEPDQEPWLPLWMGLGRGDVTQPRASAIRGKKWLVGPWELPMGVGTRCGMQRLRIPPGTCREAAPAEPAAAWWGLGVGNPAGRHFSACLYKLETRVLPWTLERGKARGTLLHAQGSRTLCAGLARVTARVGASRHLKVT